MRFAAAHVAAKLKSVIALSFTQARMVLGALAQAIVAQLQFAHLHVVLFQPIHAQQRVLVLGIT